MPVLEFRLDGDEVDVALVYRDADSLRHLKNLFQSGETGTQKAFADLMRVLPVAFETRLSKRSFKEGSFSSVRKYVSSRVDASVLSLLVAEAEALRNGGRRTIDGRSVYEAPATPTLELLYAKVKSSDAEVAALLRQMNAVVGFVSSIKTQSEIIHSRISKPAAQASEYRAFIDLANRARGKGLVSAEERRSIEKRWRESPDERAIVEEDLRRRLGVT